MAREGAGFWKRLTPLFLFTALYLVYFSPVVFGGRVLAPGDGILQNYPAFREPRSLWNPNLFSGFPAYADPQTAFWYPLSVLFSLVGSFNGFVLSAYILASTFAYAFVTRLTGSRLGGLVGGLVFGMGGFFVSHLGHGNMIHAAAWLPLLLLALDSLRERLSFKWFLVAAASVALMALAGHPQTLVFSLLLAAVFILARAGASATPIRFAGTTAGAALAGLALAGVLLIPMARLALLSVRAEMSFGEFASYSIPVRQLPAILFPTLYGGMPPSIYRLPYLGEWNAGEVTAWVGTLPLLLAALAVTLPGRRRECLLWGSVAVGALLLALGPATPLCSLLFHVPVVNKFRAQGRHVLEMSLAVSVLAGYGVAALERLPPKRRTRAVLAAGAALLLVIVASLLVVNARGDLARLAQAVPGSAPFSLSPLANPSTGLPILLAAIGVGVLAAWAAHPGRVTAGALLAIVVVDLGQYGWFFDWHSYSPRREETARPVSLDPYARKLAESHQRLLPVRGIHETEGVRPNLSSIWNLPSASGYNPLVLRSYRMFLGVEGSGALLGGRLIPGNRAFDLLAIRYLFVSRELEPPGESWRRVGAVGSTVVLENLRAMPRAWLVFETAVEDDDVALRSVVTSTLADGRPFDPGGVAILDRPLPASIGPPDPHAEARVVHLERDSLEVITRAGRPGLLVISDVNYPGWKAAIDGIPARVVSADYLLRAVRVPDGERRVRFVFEPEDLKTGAAVSLGALLLLAIAGVLAWVRRRPPADVGMKTGPEAALSTPPAR